MSGSFIKLIITLLSSKLCLFEKKKKLPNGQIWISEINILEGFGIGNEYFQIFILPVPLTYQPIKNTKVEKKLHRASFLYIFPWNGENKDQKSWSFTKAGWPVMCVRKQIVTFFRGREKREHCSFYYIQITHIKSLYLRPFLCHRT